MILLRIGYCRHLFREALTPLRFTGYALLNARVHEAFTDEGRKWNILPATLP